ncbi:2-oxoglutarate synthase subunit KorA protein [Marine Group I thaumarchaeote SCGC AAA799-E16]|uniref:2-oxoglutarate synthase subunit KorA protein n=4 Tax=Marine Group I TaxID=905826 RepID=A0A081RP46_9ARCH|nr:2-oxoglutarate synthase subunit KorA protein [Marine Group I thaumarchaeote SCGC AAA799-N04]KER05611.1 2-oxoglutarate synthase subunit KorA protein [Marine Group I thaumarchaeote SCGC AAA799-E16]KFM17041.1 2-oxoglutarate synthase subunit KorA protein [Marine Group I thaumarchaeote SCGC AAA799-D11]KFM19143.1 2-oxoglutarate synthase subunit KorA protein [Marine Group I thaumarchaeote SCGC RSA3]
MSSTDFTWLIGGPQGSGVESGANIFSRVCAEMGYQVFGKREFYSNIKGEHSYFAVRISDQKIHSNVNDVTLMASFDAETIFRHYDEVISGGGIIYDADLEDTPTDKVRTLDAPFKERLHKELESHNKPFTIAGVLEIAKEKGVLLYPVSFKSILETLAEETENPRLKGLIRMFNVIGVSLSLGLVKMPPDSLQKTIGIIFSKKEEIAKINQQTATYSYNYATAKFENFNHTITGIQKEPGTLLVQGFQGTALGKIACGCRMQSYYPITPASDESVFLESNEILEIVHERPGSTAVIQTEDEICAIGMAIGSALTGTRSATCTSGPGFALMTEMLGWAGINEVPVVITNYQRSGPSTGLPTRHGQDDLLFSVFAGHGDFPKIVYASGDVEESFYDTGNVFNYADVFQIPVIHLMDKFIASSVVTCKRFDESKISINRGKLLEKVEDGYKRFAFTDDGVSPRSRLGLDNGIFWNTGDESDETGHITEDPIMRAKMMDKRMSRLDLVLKEIPDTEKVVSFGIEDYTIISWGSAKGPIIDAIKMLKEEGISIGFIQIKLLHPFPGDYVSSLLKDVKTIIDVEANYSAQLKKLFKQNVKRDVDYSILKYTGRAMTSTEVYDSLKKIVENKAEKREVLMHGA